MRVIHKSVCVLPEITRNRLQVLARCCVIVCFLAPLSDVRNGFIFIFGCLLEELLECLAVYDMFTKESVDERASVSELVGLEEGIDLMLPVDAIVHGLLAANGGGMLGEA